MTLSSDLLFQEWNNLEEARERLEIDFHSNRKCREDISPIADWFGDVENWMVRYADLKCHVDRGLDLLTPALSLRKAYERVARYPTKREKVLMKQVNRTQCTAVTKCLLHVLNTAISLKAEAEHLTSVGSALLHQDQEEQ